MSAEILLVEDNPSDVSLVHEAFRVINGSARINVASDGEEAVAYLRREGTYGDAPRPDIILLDLNMPKMNGHQVLAHIKDDEGLKLIPTIMLTTSNTEKDILTSYRLHANCYFVKPVQWEEFVDVIKSINDFWLNAVRLPTRRT